MGGPTEKPGDDRGQGAERSRLSRLKKVISEITQRREHWTPHVLEARQQITTLEKELAIVSSERNTLRDMEARARSLAQAMTAEAKRINDIWLTAEERANSFLLERDQARQRVAELENDALILRSERDVYCQMAAQVQALVEELLLNATQPTELPATITEYPREEDKEFSGQNEAGVLAKMRAFSEAGVPLFISREGDLAFRNDKTSRRERVAVLSIPKSGTYMFGEIVRALGFVESGVHGAAWGFADLRWGDRQKILGKPQPPERENSAW